MKFLLLLTFVFAFQFSEAQKKFKPLFNGKNFKGWYTFLKKSGKDNDTAGVFSVRDKMLFITGQEFGYIITEKSYSNFHLLVEFKWGEKKYPPREKAVRDNGIVYYVGEKDKVWPRGIECQIQEGDCGDFWMIDSTTIIVDGKRSASTKNTRIVKWKDNEKPSGEWNTIEVIAKDGKCTHIVNGVVVMEGTEASLRNGRILIQSEGAETWFRRIDIKEL